MKKDAARQRRPLNKVNDVGRFRGIHEGSRCFVCGAGVTIGFLDLSGIHDSPVICVNSSILLMPWDEPGDSLMRFWVSTDALCMQWDYFWNRAMRWECTRIVRNSWHRHAPELRGAEMHYYVARRSGPPSYEDNAIMGGSSILSAIDLSLLMGCKNIFLLGVDHRMINGNSHFWQFWPKKKRPKREGKPGNFFPCQRQQQRVFKSNMRNFELLNKYAESRGSKIYNCSPETTIKTFEKISFEDALKL